MRWLDPLRRSHTRTHPLQPGGTVEVVGESNYQGALRRAAGGHRYDSANVAVTATLHLEPDNPYDPHAVAVRVGGQTVGYLARADARAYGPVLQQLAAAGRIGACQARIIGGWDRGDGDRGHFGIQLALASPSAALGSPDDVGDVG